MAKTNERATKTIDMARRAGISVPHAAILVIRGEGITCPKDIARLKTEICSVLAHRPKRAGKDVDHWPTWLPSREQIAREAAVMTFMRGGDPDD